MIDPRIPTELIQNMSIPENIGESDRHSAQDIKIPNTTIMIAQIILYISHIEERGKHQNTTGGDERKTYLY